MYVAPRLLSLTLLFCSSVLSSIFILRLADSFLLLLQIKQSSTNKKTSQRELEGFSFCCLGIFSASRALPYQTWPRKSRWLVPTQRLVRPLPVRLPSCLAARGCPRIRPALGSLRELCTRHRRLHDSFPTVFCSSLPPECFFFCSLVLFYSS